MTLGTRNLKIDKLSYYFQIFLSLLKMFRERNSEVRLFLGILVMFELRLLILLVGSSTATNSVLSKSKKINNLRSFKNVDVVL